MTFVKYRESKEQQLQRQIKDALFAYSEYAKDGNNLDEIENPSDDFVKRLANEAAESKEPLREMMRKSPAWDEALDAWVINGNRTHEADYKKIEKWLDRLFQSIFYEKIGGPIEFVFTNQWWAIDTFFGPDFEKDKDKVIEALNDIDKRIYAEGKKKSKVLRALLAHYGLWDETAHSYCQKYFALIADELAAKRIDYKLYVSINPAHILTMSNPHYDSRGSMMVSCHSLNSEYKYRNGCIGYTRDNISLIAFTVKDDEDMDNLYTRKTSRQMFFYEPESGVLLQSRMYKTMGNDGPSYGGVDGYDELSTEYRHLIQKEIAYCEGVPNLWEKPRKYVDNELNINFGSHYGFGGYEDWTYSGFSPILSVRKDWDKEKKTFTIGKHGLCFSCGNICCEGIQCDDCDSDYRCDDCDEHYHPDDLITVYDYYGNERRVCESCLDETYRQCTECGDFHDADDMIWLENEGEYVCRDCRDRYYSRCDNCGEYVGNSELESAIDDDGDEIDICEECSCNYFHWDDNRETFVSDNFKEDDEENKEEE